MLLKRNCVSYCEETLSQNIPLHRFQQSIAESREKMLADLLSEVTGEFFKHFFVFYFEIWKNYFNCM